MCRDRRQRDSRVTMLRFDAGFEGSNPVSVLFFFIFLELEFYVILCNNVQTHTFPHFSILSVVFFIRKSLCPENILNGVERSNWEISISNTSQCKIKNSIPSLPICLTPIRYILGESRSVISGKKNQNLFFSPLNHFN